MKNKIILIYLSMLLPVNFAFGGIEKYESIRNDIYSYNLKHADKNISKLLINDPSNPTALSLYYQKLFLEIIVESDKGKAKQWMSNFDDNFSEIKKSNIYEDDKNLLMCDLLLRDCVVEMYHGKELAAVNSFKKGYNYYYELKRKNKNEAEVLKLGGIYDVFCGVVPDKYEWIKNIMGLKGGIDQGIEKLRKYLDKNRDKPEFIETTFYYAVFSAFLLDNSDEAWQFFNSEVKEINHKNPLYRLSYSILADSRGESAKGLKFLRENENFQSDTKLNMLDFQIGRFLIYSLSPQASDYLIKFSKNTNSLNFKITANRLLIWYYELFENEGKLKIYRQKVKEYVQNPEITNKEEIMNELNSEIPLMKPLLKARLLFDGGYYKKAYRVLDKSVNEVLSSQYKKHKIEFLYRKGRVLQNLGDLTEALEYYSKVLKFSASEKWYYSSRSALFSADIYYDQNKDTEASKYYNLALDINSETLNSKSLKRQAKRGLNKLK